MFFLSSYFRDYCNFCVIMRRDFSIWEIDTFENISFKTNLTEYIPNLPEYDPNLPEFIPNLPEHIPNLPEYMVLLNTFLEDGFLCRIIGTPFLVVTWQLNRWPCHWFTDWPTFVFWHLRATLETYDLWDIDDNFLWQFLMTIFSCPEQLNRWPCHSLTDSLTHWLTQDFTNWH